VALSYGGSNAGTSFPSCSSFASKIKIKIILYKTNFPKVVYPPVPKIMGFGLENLWVIGYW
jgi:hypothetical protein